MLQHQLHCADHSLKELLSIFSIQKLRCSFYRFCPNLLIQVAVLQRCSRSSWVHHLFSLVASPTLYMHSPRVLCGLDCSPVGHFHSCRDMWPAPCSYCSAPLQAPPPRQPALDRLFARLEKRVGNNLAGVHNSVRIQCFFDRRHHTNRLVAKFVHEIINLSNTNSVLARARTLH